MSILSRARPEILAMQGYASARSLSATNADAVMLDANEMPFAPLIGTQGYNRYPEQQPARLVETLAALYGVGAGQLLVARGADEAIDVLTRLFCAPGGDSVVMSPPTFPMYAMAAQLNGTTVLQAPLNADFLVDVPSVLAAVRTDTKLVYLCSPNNPTGACVAAETIQALCVALKDKALVVVDEAYGAFSSQPSALALLGQYENLAVLRTLSKAMALAGVRCGLLIAQESLIAQALKVLAPYPLSVPAIEVVEKTLLLANRTRLAALRAEIMAVRDWFVGVLADIPCVEKVFPTDANFVLARVTDAEALYAQCRENGFIVRNQSHQPGLQNCLRFSIGTREQMEGLVVLLRAGERLVPPSTRSARVVRRTNETAIEACLDLDVAEPVFVSTGIGFFDHMLEQIARHGGFSLRFQAVGDLQVDAHHTIEDCAIVLGQTLRQALAGKGGIERYGFTLPMDESVAQVVLDLSGRSFFAFDGAFSSPMVGAMPTDMVAHFFRSLAENLQATLHMKVQGENDHHKIEACFKALGRALRQATLKTGDALPSTKGLL